MPWIKSNYRNKFIAYEYKLVSKSVWAALCIRSDRSWGPAFLEQDQFREAHTWWAQGPLALHCSHTYNFHVSFVCCISFTPKPYSPAFSFADTEHMLKQGSPICFVWGEPKKSLLTDTATVCIYRNKKIRVGNICYKWFCDLYSYIKKCRFVPIYFTEYLVNLMFVWPCIILVQRCK